MSFAQGRQYLAIPGPSVMPDQVLQAMHRAAPNIYGDALADLTASLIRDLKYVAGTAHHAAIYIANGHGAWEAALVNCLAPGDRVLVPAVGLFGHGWGTMAEALGITIERMEFGPLQPMDMERIKTRLAADTDHEIKAVLCAHVETSSSIMTDPRALREVLELTGHPALLMMDCIASLGCDRFEMDAWGVDVTVAASQKGLMVPPGLGFVFFNARAAEVRSRLGAVSPYWDWRPRVAPEVFYHYFAGTAPTHHLFGLRAALDMIKDEGLEVVWHRHAVLAKAIWAAVDIWGQQGAMSLNVTQAAHRSHAVTAAHLGAPAAEALRAWLESHAGVTLGVGLGMATPDDPEGKGFFRFGHMGFVNAHMVLGMLGSVEAGLQALEIPHGTGALAAAAEVVAMGA